MLAAATHRQRKISGDDVTKHGGEAVWRNASRIGYHHLLSYLAAAATRILRQWHRAMVWRKRTNASWHS